MSPEPHIDKKAFDDATLEKRLLGALKGAGKERWTVADAVVASGLPKLDTERGLKVLSRTYEGHLDVGESGEIVYRFPGGFRKRDTGGLSETLARAGAAVYTAFKWLFKVWIMFTMIAYVAIFIALIVAAFVAMMAGSQDRSSNSRSGDGAGRAAGGLLNLIARIFFWHAVMTPSGGYGYGGAYGRSRMASAAARAPKPRNREERAALGAEARPLYRKVFAFVFGDEDRADPLADDREILEHIRYLGGRVTASDLALVTGWTLDRADHEITRLLADYDGDASVTDEGALVYEFKGLLPSAQAGHGKPMPKFWDRADPVYKVSDNASGTNWGIGLANGFNLGMSFLTPTLIFPALRLDPGVWTFWLSTFPMIFSALFFAIPLVRAIGVARKNRIRRMRLVRRGWYRWVVETHERLSTDVPVDMKASVADAKKVAPPEVTPDALADASVEAAEALGGERSDEVAGAFHFRRLIRELAAGRAARLAAPKSEREVGAVVFTSETPDTN